MKMAPEPAQPPAASPPPPKTETTKTDPPAKTENEKEQPKPDEDAQVLTEIRDSYKDLVSKDQWDAVKNLSIVKQIKILKAMLPKDAASRADINTPLNTPPAQDSKPKTFLQRQAEAGFEQNLYNAGGFLARADKLYKQ